MKSAIAGFIALAAFASAAGLAACSDEKPKPPPTYDDRIVFGMSASLSGGKASVGHALAVGTQTAEVLINSLGGVLGHQVHFEIKDDASDTGTVLQGVMQDLLSRNIAALMGPRSMNRRRILYPFMMHRSRMRRRPEPLSGTNRGCARRR